MIKKLTLDVESSINLCRDCLDLLEPSMCYNNVCNIMANKFKSQFQMGLIKIGYAYVGGKNYKFVRHCVIVTNDNRVIDVSAVLDNGIDTINALNSRDVDYYVFAELNLDEYLSMLKINNYMPELRGPFLEEELEVIRILENNKYEIISDDYNRFIQEYSNLKDIT